MNGYFFFLDSETGATFTAIIQIGTDGNNVEYNSECVRLKEECQTLIGCPEGDYIFG